MDRAFQPIPYEPASAQEHLEALENWVYYQTQNCNYASPLILDDASPNVATWGQFWLMLHQVREGCRDTRRN